MRPSPPPAAARRPARRPRRLGLTALALSAGAALTGPLALTAAQAAIVPEPVSHTADDAAFELTAIGTYESGIFDASAAEIVTFHAGTQRLFVVNSAEAKVDVLDLADPAEPTLLHEITAEGIASADGTTVPAGTVANSVTVRADGLGVIAVEHPTKTEPGYLVVFDAAGDGAALGAVRVGALPDMVTVTAGGTYAVVANEGEPADDFSVDPEGSVSVIILPSMIAVPAQEEVRTADFHAWDTGERTLHEDVRVFGPTPHGEDLPISRNLEPEYIAIDGDDLTAYAALQENNAVAVVDLPTATVTDIWPLGFKDHSVEGNGLDASDRDPRDNPTINIRTYPGLKGVYQPDGIESYTVGGQTYLVTANEGDAREFGDYVEAVRAKHLGNPDETPAPTVCEDAPVADFLEDEHLGRLNVSIAGGLAKDGTCFEELHAFGARSLSIWTTDGDQLFDSGDDFEQISAAANPDFFNSNHSESNLEGRSEDKGPEPENLAIGEATAVTPTPVEFADLDGTADDTYTVPEVEGVEYVLDGEVVVAGTYPGSGTVNVEARALPGFVIADGAETVWTWTFSAEAATPTPTASPAVGDGDDDGTDDDAAPTPAASTAPNAPGGALPQTGVSAGGLLAVAGLLAAAGVAVPLARRWARR